jgi:hypothetical protein
LVCSKVSSSYILKCKQVTLVVDMQNNQFPLHSKMHNYHLEYPDVIH